MSVLHHPGPWTFDELATLPADGQRYEVVDGNLVVTPPPSQRHQLAGAALFTVLSAACPPRAVRRTRSALSTSAWLSRW